MRLRLKPLARKMLAPFRKYEQRLKKAGQRFVIKTVEQHRPHASAVPVTAAPAAGGESLLSPSMLLPLLRATRRAEDHRPVAWQALPIGKYLLTSHPRAGVIYHLPEDLAETAWIVQGDYQPDVTAWLCSRLTTGKTVVYCGSGSGYHALTAALQIGSAGKMLAGCESVDQQSLLNVNIEVHALAGQVTAKALSKPSDLQSLSASYPNAVWLINAQSPWVEEYLQLANQLAAQAFLIESHQVKPIKTQAEAGQAEVKSLRKVA